MLTYLHSCVIFGLFFQVSVNAQVRLPSVPQIYPQQDSIVVDAHTDLVLGCHGGEPLRWNFNDDVNSLHYYSAEKNITYMSNTNELDYKFETILTIYNVSHINIGFYYCHGEITDFDTARRSKRIYVFVRDNNILSVITREKYNVLRFVWFRSLPCRPTFPDINITLVCRNANNVSMSVTSSNYYNLQQTESYNIRFDPYNGFTVKGDLPNLEDCDCFFRRKDKMFSLKLDFVFHETNRFFIIQPLIEGPDTVNVGDNIILQCSLLVEQYYPHLKSMFKWDVPSSKNSTVRNQFTVKLKNSILLISTLTVKNVSQDDEGFYRCNGTKFTQKNVRKFVAVHDTEVNQSSPRIYLPGTDQEEIQVNSGENITLRCEGSRPVTCSTKYKVYKNERIIYYVKNGLYNSHLSMEPIQYSDTGFYYCHENNSVKEQSFKFKKIFIFVRDEQNLNVPQSGRSRDVFAYENATVPCIPTSREVNVTLSMEHQVFNVSSGRLEPYQSINPVIYSYDPREGFIVQIPKPVKLIALCTFVTKTANSTFGITYYIDHTTVDPYIQGPQEDLVFVGETLELTCTVFVLHNVTDDVLQWKILNNSSLSEYIPKQDISVQRINAPHGKVLISKLFIYHVNNVDEGRYTCYLPYNNATASKFINVYDKFVVKPFIENLTYHYAYIGQPLVLRCGVNVSHNVGFNMAWTASNATEKHMKIMDIEYILEVRYRKGQILLEVDNVTYENEGNYSCIVFDLKNRRENITKYVEVKRGQTPTMRIAKITVNNPEEIDVLIDETAKLTCPAEGDPKPTIIWMKGSTAAQSLGQRIGFSADNSELTIFVVQRNDAGLYTCIARNPYGQVSHVIHLHVKLVPTTGIMISVIICMTIIVIAVAVAFAKFEKNKKKRRKGLLEAGLKFGETEHAALSAYDTKWEIPKNKIQLGRNLGSGYFGYVVEATISNYFDGEPIKTVAVKMLYQNCNITELNSLISELDILAHLGKHANLIHLLGACTENISERNLLLVIEYCKHGSLRNYLLENRSNFVNLIDPDTELISLNNEDVETSAGGCGTVELQRITSLELVRWALQVARGMEFLASSKVVHGDLAARNVLLTENYVVKISDFGLSRNLSSNDYYRKRSQCSLPVKWMALESIRDKTFSIWSDVWSFGVVLWELFSLARIPYAELEPDFRFYKKLESGYRMGQPQYSTKEIYQIMRECWCARPQRRPTFPQLIHTLDNLLEDIYKRCQYHFVSMNGKCSTTANSRGDYNLPAKDWIPFDVLTSTETCST